MAIIDEGKHFRLVQDDELPDVMKVLEQYMPEALKFHQTIQTYLNDRIWKFYFYVSKKWPEEPICLHFPGCTLKTEGPPTRNPVYSSFGVFCPEARIECVDLLDSEDVLIDWHEPMYLNFTHVAIMNRLDAFYADHYGIMERLDGHIYVCEALPDDLQLDSLPADEVQMRPLTADNVQAIHDLYPASEIESVEVFERLVQTLPGFGVFTLQGELAAWMMHSYYGAMFSMQTKAEYRRKGYGIHLARALTQTVIERGYRPFVVIRPLNDASRNLYTKLGFAKAFETCRVTLNPTKLGLQPERMIVLQPHLLRAATVPDSPADIAAAAERRRIERMDADMADMLRVEAAQAEAQRMLALAQAGRRAVEAELVGLMDRLPLADGQALGARVDMGVHDMGELDGALDDERLYERDERGALVALREVMRDMDARAVAERQPEDPDELDEGIGGVEDDPPLVDQLDN